jgi:aspartate-semialdehyde dehydrogenase
VKGVIGIVGATGAVGAEFLAVFEERQFPIGELRLFASPRSAGQKLAFRGKEHVVEPLDEARLGECEIGFYSAGASISREWAPRAAARGSVVIDNSSAFRMDPELPLVVPEVNPEAIPARPTIIANPNCTTILLVVVLQPIHRLAGLERVVVATYQAASGAGAQAMQELEDQTRAVLAGEAEPAPRKLPQPIAFNLFPQVDVFQADQGDFTKEEMKVVLETRKIMGLPDLRVVSTCVRVPVRRAHSEAVFLELERDVPVDAVRAALAKAPGVELVDDPKAGRYPTPRQADGRDPVLVGRLRKDPSVERGLCLFLSGDQLRKGAALNAVQIAELLLRRG